MVRLTLDVDDKTAERLRHRAAAEGVSVEEFAARAVERAAADPYEFIGMGAADVSAGDADELLRHGFGTR